MRGEVIKGRSVEGHFSSHRFCGVISHRWSRRRKPHVAPRFAGLHARNRRRTSGTSESHLVLGCISVPHRDRVNDAVISMIDIIRALQSCNRLRSTYWHKSTSKFVMGLYTAKLVWRNKYSPM